MIIQEQNSNCIILPLKLLPWQPASQNVKFICMSYMVITIPCATEMSHSLALDTINHSFMPMRSRPVHQAHFSISTLNSNLQPSSCTSFKHAIILCLCLSYSISHITEDRELGRIDMTPPSPCPTSK